MLTHEQHSRNSPEAQAVRNALVWFALGTVLISLVWSLAARHRHDNGNYPAAIYMAQRDTPYRQNKVTGSIFEHADAETITAQLASEQAPRQVN